MTDRPRSIFFGTPSFAVPALEALLQISQVCAVVTQPDTPAGRGHELQASPIKKRAQALGLSVLEPTRMQDDAFLETIRSLKPAVAVLAAYGKILPAELLNIPTKGFVNIHPSLLPRYRGAAPVAGALLAGDATTGVTLIKLDTELDHGPIIAQESIPILTHEHRTELELRLAQLSAELLTTQLLPYLDGQVSLAVQDHASATFTTMLKREDAIVDWHASAENIARCICAYDPWPGVQTTFNAQPLKIIEAEALDAPTNTYTVGQVIDHAHGLAVVCGQGLLVLKRVQAAGKKPTSIVDFVRGHRTFIGSTLI